jgi:hypothetical protein
MEWPTILEDWLAEHWPHGVYQPYVGPWWVGYIRCACGFACASSRYDGGPPALARVEHDLIAIIDQNKAWSRTECPHNKGTREVKCYCDDTIIRISDGVGFDKLADLLDSSHKIFCVRRKEVFNSTDR